MKKVFQKIIDPQHGDCMQAVFASLFELQLEEVPAFIELGDKWWSEILKFIEQQNCSFKGYLYNGYDVIPEGHIRNIKYLTGVDGLFYAVVKSPKFHEQGGTHAILVDKDCNIIHDPNPEYQNIKYPNSDEIGYNGVVEIWIIERN